jgi:hypothetical protein
MDEEETLFRAFDEDKSNTLDVEEMRDMIWCMDPDAAWNNENFLAFCMKKDGDGNSIINSVYDEFPGITLPQFKDYCRSMREREWEIRCFDHYNADGSGFLEKSEFEKLVANEHCRMPVLRKFMPDPKTGWTPAQWKQLDAELVQRSKKKQANGQPHKVDTQHSTLSRHCEPDSHRNSAVKLTNYHCSCGKASR